MSEVRPLDMDALDEVLSAFAPNLFKAYPEWRALATMDCDDPGDGWYLVVEISSPAGGGMKIVTENDEVTVIYDVYHAHYHWPAGHGEFNDPFAMIDAILTERYAVVSYWNGKDWCGSSLLKGAADPDPDGIPPNATTARICSWRGTYSRTMTWGR